MSWSECCCWLGTCSKHSLSSLWNCWGGGGCLPQCQIGRGLKGKSLSPWYPLAGPGTGNTRMRAFAWMQGVSPGAGTQFLGSSPGYAQPVSCHWDPSHPPPLSLGELLISGITSGKSPLIALSVLAFWCLVSHLSPPPLAPLHSSPSLAPCLGHLLSLPLISFQGSLISPPPRSPP